MSNDLGGPAGRRLAAGLLTLSCVLALGACTSASAPGGEGKPTSAVTAAGRAVVRTVTDRAAVPLAIRRQQDRVDRTHPVTLLTATWQAPGREDDSCDWQLFVSHPQLAAAGSSGVGLTEGYVNGAQAATDRVGGVDVTARGSAWTWQPAVTSADLVAAYRPTSGRPPAPTVAVARICADGDVQIFRLPTAVR